MLWPAEQVDALNELHGETGLYHDLVLANNPKKYRSFVNRCVELGLIESTLACKLGRCVLCREKEWPVRLTMGLPPQQSFVYACPTDFSSDGGGPLQYRNISAARELKHRVCQGAYRIAFTESV